MFDESVWDFSVTWHIEDFSYCNLWNGEELLSPVFTVDAFDNKKWYLSIYPRGNDVESEGYISCFLNNSKDNISDEQGVETHMQIKIADHKILGIYSSPEECIQRSSGKGWDNFIKTDKALSEMKKCFTNTLTLHCCMKKNHKTSWKGAKGEIRTRMAANKSSFEWNMSLESLINQNFLQKRYFYLENRLYQISIDMPQDDVIVRVRNAGENELPVYWIDGKIALLDVYGNKTVSKKDSHIFHSKNLKDSWDFPSLISKKQLLDNISEMEKAGKVVLLCEFSLSKINSGEILNPNCDAFTYLDGIINLSDNYRKLFADKTNSDLILRSSNNDEIRAHKSVLTAHSPVFSTMFNCDMIENRDSIVDIVDLDTKSIEYFLQFLYTGYVDDMDFEMASKLLMTAEKYQVPSLKEKCSLFLLSILSVENVCEILVLADMADREFLKKTAMNLAAENYLTVFPSPENSAWVKENVNLFTEVLSHVGRKFKVIPKTPSD